MSARLIGMIGICVVVVPAIAAAGITCFVLWLEDREEARKQ
jgi:hypothetical protein